MQDAPGRERTIACARTRVIVQAETTSGHTDVPRSRFARCSRPAPTIEVTATIHVPVLVPAVMQWLDPKPGQTLVDGTLGGAGHAKLLAEAVGAFAPRNDSDANVSAGRLIAVDRDRDAVEIAAAILNGPGVNLAAASYDELPEVLAQLSIPAVDGILLDIGLSSDQLADGSRGFSYLSDGELDMRFDREVGEPAWQLLQHLPEFEIAKLIYEYGEERFSRRVAKRIVETRAKDPIRTAAQLADLVRSCVPRSKNHRIDPATRTFQALRIAVNDELGILERALRRLPDLLKPADVSP